MWPKIHLPGTDITLATYLVLNVAGWFAFLYLGLGMTSARPEFRQHCWLLFLGMVLCCSVGSSTIYRLLHAEMGATRWERLRHPPPRGGYYGGPLLFLGWTGLYILARRIRAYPFLDVAIAFSISQAYCLQYLSGFLQERLFRGGLLLRPSDGFRPGRGLPCAGRPDPAAPDATVRGIFPSVTALILVLLYARGRLRGRLVMVLGAIYGGWRLLIEPVRAVHPLPFLGGPLTTKQVASLLIVVFCTTYLFLDRLSVRRAERRSGPGIAC